MTENFEQLTKRLQETVCTSRQNSSLLVREDNGDELQAVPAVTKICNILSFHLAVPIDRKKKSISEECIFSSIEDRIDRNTINLGNLSLPYPLPSTSETDKLSSSFRASIMSTAGDPTESGTEDEMQDEGQETSLVQDTYVKQYLAEHESQVVLWEQMTSFRREYMDMRAQVESILTRLHMDFSNMTRDASCNFVLLLSQMGCPSCSTGAGLEACSERLKNLEVELEKARSESSSLSNRVESAMEMNSHVQDKLGDRENVIQSLTETIDQLQSHCHQLEENSSDGPQWEELIVKLEGALRSIGRLVVDDSDLYSPDYEVQLDGEETTATNWTNLPLLAESTLTAVRAVLSRRRGEIQQLQSAVNEFQQKMVQTDQTKGDIESRERAYQKELKDLRSQLSEMAHEKQLQKESVLQAERSNKNIQLELEEKEKAMQKLKDELHREKSSRQRMEESLEELKKEEAHQKSTHTELLTEIQQLSCDNQMCRTNISTFEERFNRLRREMDQMREERTRLTVALDFSKDERNQLIKQLKELEDKTGSLKEQSRSIQMEKMSVEDSLCRLQVHKSLDETQIQKLNADIEQIRKESSDFLREREELNEEVSALKHELVKAEELRTRLESFNSSLEHSLNVANVDNVETKEQIETLIQINEQLTEKQSSMEQRYAEIETGNNHLMEEIGKLTREFTLSKEREQSWKEEVDRLRLKINSLEEETRAVHQQLLGAQNVNHLTQVSLIATQTSYEELQIELERVTKEMQAIGAEKESLLMELQQLNESTNNAVAQLQEENKTLSRDINDLDKQLHDVANEKTLLLHGVEKERLEKKATLQSKLLEVQQEHKRHIELVQNQHSKVVQDMQKDMAQQLAKLQEQLNKRESEKQQQLAQVQGERKALQDKLSACAAELESERKELARVRQEEAELQAEHSQSVENFRSEISRLHSDLRSAGESRSKEMQTAEQILAVTNESLKRSEQDFGSAKTELSATNRQLKDAQRQLEALQIQLSKMESQRDDARKEGLQRGGILDELQNERSELRNSIVGFQTSIKRLESEREDIVKCLEEARKRIAVLEENRGVLEREIHHLRTLVKDADQQVARLTEDLNVNQQKLERSQDAQNRWKERSEALVEQLQAEQNRTILAEQAVTKYMNKAQAIKMHFQQMEQQYTQKLQQSGTQHSLHQQRLDEMDVTVQKTIGRSKRLEEERHNFHSRLIEADKEVGILKTRLREADSQAQDLTDQMHRLELEKRELNSRFGVLYSTLKRFIRTLEDTHQGNINNKSHDSIGTGVRFLQPLSTTMDSDMSIMRETSSADPDAIQVVLQDLMRHILQLQARRAAETAPNRDEPTRLELSSRERQRQQLSRHLRDSEGNAAGLREQLHASLNTVASHTSLGPQTLHRESTRLDGLVSGVRRFDSSPIRPDGAPH
ncbi:paramyosin-like isoform X1 [Daphnia pulex]|uniref:paramyosin-like isoform X1 n=2 Tax=Daphnia pulex TaxID=6669 RepID=UPI001EDCE242|nr:paramyosin-like isoform X1 [Daphnia pulex]